MKKVYLSLASIFIFISTALLPLATLGQATILISQGGTVSVNDGDLFYDAGGAAGNDGNTSYTITLVPAISGESVCVDFTSFITNLDMWGLADADRLEIYDGLNTSANQIGSLQGNYGLTSINTGTPYNTGQAVVGTIPAELKPGIFCANNASGALTFRFFNQSSSQFAGWVGVIRTYVHAIPGCTANITADQATICDGGSVNLTATGTIASATLDNNFNSSTIGSGWSSTPGTISFMSVLTCQPNNGYDSRNNDLSVFAWMQNVAAPRTLETAAFDVSSGGYISFDFRMASDDNGGNGCEAADNKEGVYLQYSNNGGTSWTTMKLMFPGEEGGGVLGCGNYVYDWNTTTVPIPAAAQTATTKFRWIQAQSTSGSEDSWGIDNVKVSAQNPMTITVTNQTAGGIVVGTSTVSPLEITETPSVTTTYVVTVTDGISTCTNNVVVTVNSCATLSCGSCSNANCPIGLEPDYPNAELHHINYCNVPATPIMGPQVYVTYHTVTVNSSGILGVVASSWNGGTAGCASTRTFKLYPTAAACTAGTGTSPTIANANGSPYSNPEWSGLTPGTYILEITHTIAAGCGLYDNCQAYYSPACTPVVPSFSIPTSICSGSVAPTLPTTSTNGIIGTWSPATASNTVSGSYIFTPDANQCAGDITLNITVSAGTPPSYTSTATDVSCVGPNSGAIDINPVGSTTTFDWVSGPVTSPVAAGNLPVGATDERELINLPIGTYCVDITNTSTTTSNTTLFVEDFEAGISAWTIDNSIGSNQWVCNNNYTGGTCVVSGFSYPVPNIPNQPAAVTNNPNSYYLHIKATSTAPVVCGAGTTSPFPPLNANFNGSDNAANQKATINSVLNTTGMSNVVVSFYWMGDGDAADYCVLESSINGGATWIQSGAKLNNQLTWTTATRTDATWANQSDLRFRFRWVNNTATGQDPAICIDQIIITADQTSTCSATVQECFTIAAPSSVIPSFTGVGPYCQGGVPAVLPTTSNNGITGSWNAAISTATGGTTTYTFTPNAAQCATTQTMDVVVNAQTVPAFTQLGPYCQGSVPAALPTTSTNGVTGTWNAAISTASAGTTTYTFTPTAGLCATTKTMDVVVNAQTVPAFTQLGPYCVGAVAAILPTTSNNGVTGTWNAAISTAAANSTVYTFTPTAGLCATTVTMTVVVSNNNVPLFTQLGPYCVGAVVGTLPTVSTNGITGTWNSAVSTASAATTTYTFTPAAGQCAVAETMDIVVNANVVPVFTQLGPYCQGDVPASLQTTSTNGISGTWNAAISTVGAGTTVYTFTPSAGQCATTATMSIVVNASTLPTFTSVGPYCQGDVPAVLPTTSNNAITGSWNAAISTATGGTTVYTFTPNAGQCASVATMNVTVNSQTTPTFTQLGPYCVGAAAATLPTTSTNGVTGTWNAAISTASAGTTVYTFTPTAGLCATTANMSVVVNTPSTPTFTAVGPYCQGNVPAVLPTISNNAINGTWNAAISTATGGTTVYTFTPSAGQCATTATMSVQVNANVVPTFTQLGPYCQGDVPAILPTTSTNGVTGTWNTTISTATGGTTVYTFTPTAGLCATTVTMSVVVNAQAIPTFTQLGPYCQNDVAGILPTTSLNGYNGSWNIILSTATAGTTTYIFTPTPGSCVASVSMNVVVNAPALPTFNPLTAFCQSDVAPLLPSVSLNGFTGSWNPAVVDNQTSATYTFTPDLGQCALNQTLNSTVEALPIVSFTANPLEGCVPLSVQFINNSTGATTYQWDLGNGNNSSLQNPTALYTNPDLYSVTLIATSPLGCASSLSLTDFIEAYPRPSADFMYSLGSDVISDNIVEFTDLSDGATAWNWNFGDEANGSSIVQNPVYHYEVAGTYWICLQIENEYSCTNTVCRPLTIEPFNSVYLPNAFTPDNGDGINDYFNVKGEGIETMHLVIFNRWGEQIFETTTQEGGWDGTYKGVRAQEDVYTYVLYYVMNDGIAYQKYGRISLVY